MPLERCLVDYFPKTNLPEWGLHPLNSIRRRFFRQKCSFPRRKRRKWVIPHSFVNGCARRCLICIFVIFRFSKFSSPDEGLEPATLRLKVWCSTDWANRACVVREPEMPELVRNAMRENQLIGNRKKRAITTIAHFNYLLTEITPWRAHSSHWRQMLSLLTLSNDYLQLPCPVSSVGRASDF